MVYTLKVSTPQLKNSLDKELQVSFHQKAPKIKTKKEKNKNLTKPTTKTQQKISTPQQNRKSQQQKTTKPQEPLTWVQTSSSFNPLSKTMHQKEICTTLKATSYIQWGVQMIKTPYRSLFSFHPCNRFMDRKSGTSILKPQVCIHGQVLCFLHHSIQ